MTAQVSSSWADSLGRLIDGARDLGLAYIDADRAQEIPDFEAYQATMFQQQQQTAAQAAAASKSNQTMLIWGAAAAAVLFLLTRNA